MAPPTLQDLLNARFSDAPTVKNADFDVLTKMAGRGSCREFREAPVPDDVLDVLCATALSSPTKSDLQQRDIILLKSQDVRERLASLVSEQAWVKNAPMIAVFCGNNRRQRLWHQWRNIPFANDHLDAFLNAAADAAIALGAFVAAAEAIGLGCCPISAVRNKPRDVSELLGLPHHVFPFAGLAIGYPKAPSMVAKRLPISVTCHVDRYQETDLEGTVSQYDLDRQRAQPYKSQRFVDVFGEAENYGWSADKARQYSQPERADFGSYIRSIGFCLD